MPYRCVFGCKTYKSMHCFPNIKKNSDQFFKWIKIVSERLNNVEDYKKYKDKRICNIHFKENDWNRYNRLNALAIPSLHLPNLKSDDGKEACDPVEIKKEDNIDNEPNFETEYLEEYLEPEFDKVDKVDQVDKATNTDIVDFETQSRDEIDTLFASYIKSFRKIQSKLQIMLKLDLAKLFARYEMKNVCVQESKKYSTENKKTILDMTPEASQPQLLLRKPVCKQIVAKKRKLKAHNSHKHVVRDRPDNSENSSAYPKSRKGGVPCQSLRITHTNISVYNEFIKVDAKVNSTGISNLPLVRNMNGQNVDVCKASELLEDSSKDTGEVVNTSADVTR